MWPGEKLHRGVPAQGMADIKAAWVSDAPWDRKSVDRKLNSLPDDFIGRGSETAVGTRLDNESKM